MNLQRSTKRIIDVIVASIGILVASFPVTIACIIVYLEDGASPFYTSNRIGKKGRSFKMWKIRTMKVGSEKSGVMTTTNKDSRLLRSGHLIRRWKLDEFLQLIHVLHGTMSIVGPRPNVPREVANYSSEELRLITVKPGITDISSVVFSDLSTILADASNPNLAYNTQIRPWKSRLSLFQIRNSSTLLDITIIALTALAIISPTKARIYCKRIVISRGESSLLPAIERDGPPPFSTPPGLTEDDIRGKGIQYFQSEEEAISNIQTSFRQQEEFSYASRN